MKNKYLTNLRSTTPEERAIARARFEKLKRTKEYKLWANWQFKRQRKRCFYCDQRIYKGAFHVDHRVPINMGGTNDFSNLCMSCRGCNITKSGDKLWEPRQIYKLSDEYKARDLRRRHKQLFDDLDEMDEHLANLLVR